MYTRVVVPVFVAFGMMQEAHSFLKLSRHTVGLGREEQLPDLGKVVDKAGEHAKKAGENIKNAKNAAADKLQKKDEKDTKDEKDVKPMDPIEVMRAMMCWGRKNLLDHKDCMTWMVKNCQKETTGEGYCKKLRRYVKSKCKRGDAKGCDYAKQLGIDVATDKEVLDPDDLDGDGVKDKDDAFPDNPGETKDSDGDGVGDNTDEWPTDPSCSKKGDICAGSAPAPAAPGGLSPAPAPAPASDGLKMDENVPLPSQGFNEHSASNVAHDDGKTMTSDWRSEWPSSGGDEESSIKKICEENPNHAWCRLKQSASARKAYRAAHP